MLVGMSQSLLGKEWIITKAFDKPDGSVNIEGWISTPIKDMEKDILEPEAFAGEGLTAYFQRGAPISSNHDTKAYPVGFLQKAVLIRDGKIIQAEDNPLHDRTEFLDFNGMGTGWYGLGNIYNLEAATNVRKGTVRAFSWIGSSKEWETLPDGGRRFSKKGAINPLMEVTITAYPINTTAIMRIAKAYGFDVDAKPKYLVDRKVVQILVDAAVNGSRGELRAEINHELDRVFERKF